MKIDIKSLYKSSRLSEATESLKRQTIAFVPGSMKPPHRGHWDMVEEYAQKASKVVVLISKPSAKSARKTKLGTVITPEQAKQILEVYKLAYGLKNVDIEISNFPSPLPSVIDYLNKHNVKNADVILGASDKDDDWKRWTAPYVQSIIKRVEAEPNGIKFLDPQANATHRASENKGATFLRQNIDNYDAIKDQLPTKLDDKQKRQVFDIMNGKSESLKEALDTARKGLTKLYQLNFSGIRNVLKAIAPKVLGTGLQMNIIPKSDGSAVRIAWDKDNMYIESSHSGLVSNPSEISFVPGFSETLAYLQKPEIAAKFKSFLTGTAGVKLIGELLYNAEEYQDLDKTITFVGTKYDSTKLGKVATIILFDAMKMQGDSLIELPKAQSQKIINTVCKRLSDENVSFMSNTSFTKSVTITKNDFQPESVEQLKNIDQLSNAQLDALRNEFEALMIKHCQNVEKPEIVKTDIIEGIVFEIPGLGEFAVQNPAWVDTKKTFYKYRTAFDDLVISFIKNVTGWAQKKKILSVFDASKDSWQPKFAKLVVPFKKDLDKAYNDFISHKSEIPNYVFAISKKMVDSVYEKMSNLTDDVESLRTALTTKSSGTQTINEGGTLFDNASRISQSDVQSTLDDIDKNLLSLFKISMAKGQAASVGSTGKKLPTGSSGDIDLGLDQAALLKSLNASSYKDIFTKMNDILDKANIEYHYVPSFNETSVLWPIISPNGKQTGKYVQVDLMPVADLEYLSKYGEFSPAEVDDKTKNEPKSAVRNAILRQMAKARDQSDKTAETFTQYEFSPRDGLLQHTFSNVGKSGKRLSKPQKVGTKVVSTNPSKILQIIFNDKNIKNYDKHLTPSAVWNEFIKSDIGKDPTLRQQVAKKIVAELNPKYAGAHAIPTPQEIVDVADGKTPQPMDLSKFNSMNEREFLKEGGNAIVQKGKSVVAARIKKEDVEDTKADIDKNLLVPLKIKLDDAHRRTIGSLGKKPDSGDIDLAIQVPDKEGEIEKFIDYVAHEVETNPKLQTIRDLVERGYKIAPNKGLKEVSVPWPIVHNGQRTEQVVQVDLMPTTSIDSLVWAKHSPTSTESKYKGAVRNIFLEKIASNMKFDKTEMEVEYKGKSVPGCKIEKYVLFGHALKDVTLTCAYVINRKGEQTLKELSRTDKIVTTSPDKIVQFLFSDNSLKATDCLTTEQAWELFKKSPIFKDKVRRSKILSALTKELNARPLDYPSEFDANIDQSALNESIKTISIKNLYLNAVRKL